MGAKKADKLINAVCKLQINFADFIAAEAHSQRDDSKTSFVSKDDAKIHKANLLNAKSNLRVLNSVFAGSGLSYTECVELGSNQPRSSFNKLKKTLSTESLSFLTSRPKTGRQSLIRTHSDVIADLSTHLHSDSISTASNVRTLKEFGTVYETHQPPYLARAAFPQIKPVEHGGGRSQHDRISISSAYKYMPRDVVKAQQESMRCSDHAQRKTDISYIHTHVWATRDLITVDSIGPLARVLGTVDDFKQIMKECETTPANQVVCLQRYNRLSGTQLHHTHNAFQSALVRSHRTDLPELSSSSCTDFGQNGVVGLRKVMTEATERNLSAVTVFAMTFTYHLPSQNIRHMYVCVLSDNLTHSAWNALCYMRAALAVPKVRRILKMMKTHHSWSDNGSHLCCLENTTFWMRDFPTLFPNYGLITENRTCPKHGKSLADLCVRLFNDNVRTLATTDTGWVSPKRQMKDLAKVRAAQNAQLLLAGKQPLDFVYVWCQPQRAPTEYKVLDCSTVDISSCRKFLRLPDGTTQVQEVIRYDVAQGVVLSPKLVQKTRPCQPQKIAQPVPSIDFGVCSVARQAERHRKRLEFLQRLSAESKTDLSDVAKMLVPRQFDHTTMPAMAGVMFEQTAKRGVGRQPAQPIVRSRKRSVSRSDREGVPSVRKKFRHIAWDLDEAIRQVLRVANSCNETVYIPSRAQFASQNHTYLYGIISVKGVKIFGVSRAEFAKRVGLRWPDATKIQNVAVV